MTTKDWPFLWTYTSNIPYIARLFEVNDKNLAYIYSDHHLRNQVGDDEKKMDDNGDDNVCYKLLKEWKLEKYVQVLMIDNGYDDVELWNDLSVEELKRYGFLEGHAKKFVKKTRAYLDKLND